MVPQRLGVHFINSLDDANALSGAASGVNAGKQGASGKIAMSVSRRYYVGIASVEGSVFRFQSRLAAALVKQSEQQVKAATDKRHSAPYAPHEFVDCPA